MSKRPIPHQIMDSWFLPAQTQWDARHDLARYGASVPPKKTLLDWVEQMMRSFDRPVLVAWATEDR